jgi:hypothetical protein
VNISLRKHASDAVSSVETSPVAGNSFTNSCDNWQDGTFDNFKDWAVRKFGLKDPVTEDEAEIPVENQKAKDIVFERNDLGELILPPLANFKNVKQKQRVIRGFIGAAYSKFVQSDFQSFIFLTQMKGDFTGIKNAAFPYISAAKAGQKIYSRNSVPKGFALGDPDHLSCSKIESLYFHLLARQKKGLRPFVILNSSTQHRPLQKKSEKSEKGKGKGKMKYVDVHSSDDNEEEKEMMEGGYEKNEENSAEEEEEELEEEEDPEQQEDEDVDEYELMNAKFGPPAGQRRKEPPSTPIAGPSKISPPKKSLTIKKTRKVSPKKSKLSRTNTQVSNHMKLHRLPMFNYHQMIENPATSKTTNSKKRKRDDDLAAGMPGDQAKKSRRQGKTETFGSQAEQAKTGQGRKSSRLVAEVTIDEPVGVSEFVETSRWTLTCSRLDVERRGNIPKSRRMIQILEI